jgi:glutaminyl-peptide cyclotransferase
MVRARALAAALAALGLALLGGCGAGEGGGQAGDGRTKTDAADGSFDAERAFADLRAQVRLGPRPAGSAANRRNAQFIARRLRAAGAEGVRVQRPWRNVVARIPGREPGVIVVGAHHDTKDEVGEDFVGANDGASGVAVVLELARALAARAPLEGRTVALALFDGEEARGEREFTRDGMRGSRQYVRYARAGGRQGAPPLQRIEAMVLFDMVGDCDLALPREANSDPGLYAVFEAAARERTGSAEPFVGERPPVLDDHIPFIAAGVPAVDLIDFSYGPENSWWHTGQDTLERVCPESLDAVGEAALAALPRLP